jgi:hypothetical protein
MQVKVVDKVSGVVRYIQADARLYNNHLKAKQRNLDKRKQNTPGSESAVIVNIMAEDDDKQ